MNRSEDLKDLFSALAKAQAEMESAGLTSNNPFFKSKYADLAEIVRSSRPALTKNGLSVIQQIMANDNGDSYLHTLLCHSSGQWIESRIKIAPQKTDVQSLGSYITYLRRYSYAALVNVIVCDESDDDGETAVRDPKEPKQEKPLHRDDSNDPITQEQLEQLEDELNGHPDLAKSIMDSMKIKKLSDFPKSKFLAGIKKIQEIKRATEGKKQ